MDLLSLFYKNVLRKERTFFYDKHIANPKLICILRVRNEELILEDTLNHLSSFCDGIVAYEDASTDKTFAILKNHGKVFCIMRNFHWLKNPEDRIRSESAHRLALLNLAKSFNPEWIFCADADERYIGDIRGFITSPEAVSVDLVRISLYDAYITAYDREDFLKGKRLINFRKYFGPERRDIIMLWRANREDITFEGLDSREPVYSSDRRVITKFYCQHYGKALSIKHWEDTSNYYANHFPEPYKSKWQARKGKAVHASSDFDTPLYTWDEVIKTNKVIYP